jgi:hypothetical protein
MPRQRTTFEIYTDNETPYGSMRGIRLSDMTADNKRVFATFSAAKRELTEILRADEDELRERMLYARYNRQDLRRLRRKELDD